MDDTGWVLLNTWIFWNLTVAKNLLSEIHQKKIAILEQGIHLIHYHINYSKYYHNKCINQWLSYPYVILLFSLYFITNALHAQRKLKMVILKAWLSYHAYVNAQHQQFQVFTIITNGSLYPYVCSLSVLFISWPMHSMHNENWRWSIH